MQSQKSILICGLVLGLLCAVGHDCLAQPPLTLKLDYQGVDRCLFCHQAPQDNVREDVLKFVTLKEMDVWMADDKHYRALSNITDTDLGKQMCRTLGIDVNNIATATQCVSCHSNPHWVNNHRTISVDPRRPNLQTGVTCESCHGPSSIWDPMHTKSAVWRAASPDDKQGLGMLDVRNPVTRARMCYSCHIGDASEGKVVTHEMYAAGHPPLPSVELETFSHAMPAHWRSVADKPDFEGREQFLEVNSLRIGESERLRNVILGAAVAYQSSMKLVADQLRTEDGRDVWPQLSSFDCYACHHDLALPGWRQARGYPGRPGRPQLNYWPSTLVELGASRLRDARRAAIGDLAEPLGNLQAALDRRPFGDPTVIGGIAADVVEKLEALIAELGELQFGGSDADQMLAELCQLAQSPTIDYESARQIGWAFQVILQDSSYVESPTVSTLLDGLSHQLKLQLPAGQAAAGDKPRIVIELPAALKAASNYEPADFRDRMLQMSELLVK